MKKDWVLNIKRQCDEQGVPFFFKQWGTYGEDGIKRNAKANGCTIDGKTYQAWPKNERNSKYITNKMTVDFTPHTETFTIVYDNKGNEIDRINGIVDIKGKDYADRLPIEYRHISITTQVNNIIKIEKNEGK